MQRLSLRFDMRAPAFGASADRLYAASIDMAEYVDRQGFHNVALSEHHGVSDGYLPSPIVLAAAMAARTRHLRLELNAVVAPLHDPLRLAEDLAVLDQISGGRTTLTLVGGYVPAEFAMFGKDMKQRPSLMEETVLTLKAAWTGKPFSYRGRPARITPRPVQRPHPPIVMGGSVPAAALRAGRLADGFLTHRADLHQIYYDEAVARGRPAEPFRSASPGFLYVTDDPAAAWKVIAPHAFHEMNSYGEWVAGAGTDGRFKPVGSIDELKASGAYVVVTPAECVALAPSYDNLMLHPLMGGLGPAVGWRGLEMFVEKVLPALR